ncbi:MAG TPA: hypothetical protein VF407_03745 [Polyangiaceae bacterium]
MTWRRLVSVVLFFGGSGLALACEAVSHANDYQTQGAIQTCGEGTLFCNGACVAEDIQNCGSCGATCEPTQVCSEGKCGSSCTGGTTQCTDSSGKSVCVDTQNDPKNCGRCGGFPDAGVCTVCVQGTCQASCGNLSQCGSACSDLTSDPLNCGTCGKQCGQDQVCAGGVCGVSCGSLDTCDKACVSLKTDAQHCGSCSNKCNKPDNGVAVCVQSICRASCFSGFTTCGQGVTPGPGDQSCVNIATDPNNCGHCGVVCPPLPNGPGGVNGETTGICINGACSKQ